MTPVELPRTVHQTRDIPIPLNAMTFLQDAGPSVLKPGTPIAAGADAVTTRNESDTLDRGPVSTVASPFSTRLMQEDATTMEQLLRGSARPERGYSEIQSPKASISITIPPDAEKIGTSPDATLSHGRHPMHWMR